MTNIKSATLKRNDKELEIFVGELEENSRGEPRYVASKQPDMKYVFYADPEYVTINE
ncbi:hypothetical protein FIU93_22820 [Labrenzia sp. THAF35]|uniref:hypothetical protein n=1 Tax=Labrenzia sp. THAF35 TaxID=2587854 RepID=UPI0012A8EE56|nr:hypothetical protein [Labrenzia sp. THAF35]QFT69635.1 hypothetical protein FIU93_22820 [Labrenzia sp. THAF35]